LGAGLFLFSCLLADLWHSDQCRGGLRTYLGQVGSVMRVVEPNTRNPAARIACRNAGVEVLLWDTRNGNPNEPSL
jgi:hypothetical protein